MRSSMKYQLLQADTTTEFLRDHIRDYCKKHHYKGRLVDLYNKTYQLNDVGLFHYLDTQISYKLFKNLISSY